MDMSLITVEVLRAAMARKGHDFFERGDWNVNLIGVRSADMSSNTFNDVLCVVFKQAEHWQLLTFDMTTDPGQYWREHPMNTLGTAILTTGQHKGAFKLGRHQGRYDALVQAAQLPVYRDNDQDAELDTDTCVDTGWHGINLHRAGATNKSVLVDKWSAGCQVVADPDEFDMLLAICQRAARQWGDSFTYTLIREADLGE